MWMDVSSYERLLMVEAEDPPKVHVDGCQGHGHDISSASTLSMMSELPPSVPVVNKGYIVTLTYTLDIEGPNCMAFFVNGIHALDTPRQYWVVKNDDNEGYGPHESSFRESFCPDIYHDSSMDTESASEGGYDRTAFDRTELDSWQGATDRVNSADPENITTWDNAYVKEQHEDSAVNFDVVDKSLELDKDNENDSSTDSDSPNQQVKRRDKVLDVDYEPSDDGCADFELDSSDTDFSCEEEEEDSDYEPSGDECGNSKRLSRKSSRARKESGDHCSLTDRTRMLFSCPRSKVCTKRYFTESRRDLHIRIHDFLAEYCKDNSSAEPESECSQDLVEKCFLQLNEKKSAPCPIDSCDKQIFSIYGFDVHMLQVHMPERFNFPCPEKGCELTFAADYLLSSHMTQKHPRDTSCCDICGKILRNAISLKRHLVTHTDGKRIYKCPVPGCKSDFAVEKYLKQHAKTHRTAMNYLCQICGKSYKRSECLRAHFLSVSHKRMVEKNPD